MIPQIAEILKSLVRLMVDWPNEVQVIPVTHEGGVTLTITSHPKDIGKIIGKMGRTARSLRSIVNAIGMAQKVSIALDIAEESNSITGAKSTKPEKTCLIG